MMPLNTLFGGSAMRPWQGGGADAAAGWMPPIGPEMRPPRFGGFPIGAPMRPPGFGGFPIGAPMRPPGFGGEPPGGGFIPHPYQPQIGPDMRPPGFGGEPPTGFGGGFGGGFPGQGNPMMMLHQLNGLGMSGMRSMY